MLWLRRLELPGPLWINVYASPPGRGPLGKFQLWTTVYGLGGAEPGSEETSPLLEISP